MKNTPKTNEYIHLINEAIDKLRMYFDFSSEPYMCMYPKEDSDELLGINHMVEFINLNDIKCEFIDTLEDYNKIFFQVKLFAFKFEYLLNWKFNHNTDVGVEQSQYNKLFSVYSDFQLTFQVDIHSTEYFILKSQFINLCFRISNLKYKIKRMLDDFETIGNLYLESSTIQLKENQSENAFKSSIACATSEIKPAPKKKTDIIKILSAMYDARMFADAEGKPLTNKQKMMEAFGEFLGDDFSAYSTSLSQAKIRDRKTFMKPFTEIEKAAERYLEEC